MNNIETADIVKHAPTGEDWLVGSNVLTNQPPPPTKCPAFFDCKTMTGEAAECPNQKECDKIPKSILWRQRA
jgi:hypothetical protein